MPPQNEQPNKLPDGPGELAIECERLTPTRTRAKVWLKGTLIYCDIFDVCSATAGSGSPRGSPSRQGISRRRGRGRDGGSRIAAPLRGGGGAGR